MVISMLFECQLFEKSPIITVVPKLIWQTHLIWQIISVITIEQGKSEWFYNYDRPSNLTQIGLKLSPVLPIWPWNVMVDDLEKQ